MFILIGNDVFWMKSCLIGKWEVICYVILCDFLLNDGLLSFVFNWLIVLKVLIYFLIKVEIEFYSEIFFYFFIIKLNILIC